MSAYNKDPPERHSCNKFPNDEVTNKNPMTIENYLANIIAWASSDPNIVKHCAREAWDLILFPSDHDYYNRIIEGHCENIKTLQAVIKTMGELIDILQKRPT